MAFGVWNTFKNSISSCCCYSSFRETPHGRLTPFSEENHPSTSPGMCFDNPVLDENDLNNFTMEVLDSVDNYWRQTPRLRLHEISLDENKESICSPRDKTDQHKDSNSLGRESGYGQSIEEGLEYSSGSEVSVGVMEDKSRATYKLIVQDRAKCWCVFRRQLDFVYIQEYIKKQIGAIGEDLPVEKKVNIEDLKYFVQRLTSDSRLLQLPKVREFLHLDRYRSSTGGSSESSDDSIPVIVSQQSKPKVILNPGMLVPASLSPIKKPFGENGESNIKSYSDKVSSNVSGVPLGCEEKKMAPSDFEFLTLIGKGSFGKVFLARRKEDDKFYAVKMLNKKLILRKNETAHVMSERSALTRVLRHPYIVTLHYAFTTSSKIFFVLDYINGGELFYHLQNERTFTEKRTRFYAAEICCALTYMHSKGIVYRDLKPENILLDKEGHIILTDFGLCKEGIETSSSRTSTFCGTPEYLAPEVILKKPYTRSVDWWTYGAVLYELLYGLPPFYYKDIRVMYDAIISKPLKLKATVSTAARDLLYSLLQKSPSRRLGSGPRDGTDVMAHSFFSSIDWSLIEEKAVAPPFVPKVVSDDDISNIDPLFTREKIGPPSIGPTCSSLSAHENKVFRGFSYVCPGIDENER